MLPDRAKILLVDDREENLLALEAILGSLGHELVRARSGEEALKYLLTDTVSLILLDVQMPDMDGYETATHIQSRHRTQNIPIIFLTAIDREARQAYRGYAAGAVDFLAKPFDPWMLRAKVQVFLRLQTDREALEGKVDELTARVETLAPTNLDTELAQVERLISISSDDELPPMLAEAMAVLRRVRGELQRSVI